MSHSKQPNLWDAVPAPAPPTGPETGAKARGSREDCDEWLATEDGKIAWCYMVREARHMLDSQVRQDIKRPRVSTQHLIEKVREIYRVEVNHNFRSYLSDDLVTFDPRLLGVVERRTRKNPS